MRQHETVKIGAEIVVYAAGAEGMVHIRGGMDGTGWFFTPDNGEDHYGLEVEVRTGQIDPHDGLERFVTFEITGRSEAHCLQQLFVRVAEVRAAEWREEREWEEQELAQAIAAFDEMQREA
jgi:hypothetical protein